MALSAFCPLPERLSLNEHLRIHAKVPDDLRHLILSLSQATKYIQHALRMTEAGLAGKKNQFGEEQLQLDVLSDTIIRQHLCESRLVASFASEEQDCVVELDGGAPYSVVYDPLDGSSLVDANFAIGSIFGIYPRSSLIGAVPRSQVAALYALYGPRTVLVYTAGNAVHEFLLNEVGEFLLLREYLGIGDIAKNYSPGNLRAVHDNRGYHAVMNEWLSQELTLRYSGCMVADIHHIFSKGQGIFVNVGGSKYPEGKLRLIFECGPFAYLAEQAGGSAVSGKLAILDTEITGVDQRTPIILGSRVSVEHVVTTLTAP